MTYTVEEVVTQIPENAVVTQPCETNLHNVEQQIYNVKSEEKVDVEQPAQTQIPGFTPVRGNRDINTIDPTPHSVFKIFKTGGYLGNNVLLWGDIKKHSFFPFVALAGRDWPVMLCTYTFFIGLMVANIIFLSNVFYRLYLIIPLVTIQLILFWCLLTTTLSDPGIIFRGEPPRFKEQAVSQCRTCEVGRPLKAIHCSICNCCYLECDHHCPWMGKCIAKNNYVLFYISVMSMFFMIMLSGIIVIIADVLNIPV